MTKDEVRTSMIQHIHAHNTPLTKELLSGFTTQALTMEVHPNYREYYEKQLKEATKKERSTEE